MRTLNDLTESEKQSLNDHYKSQHEPFLNALIETVAKMVKENDCLALAWLNDCIKALMLAALDRMPSEPDVDPGPLVCGWPRKQNLN